MEDIVATLTPDMVEKLGLGLMWVPTMTLAMVALFLVLQLALYQML
jgi:hypothetical protein